MLATGAQHAYFGHDDWATFAPGLKTIDDATYLRRRILLAFESAETEPDADERRRLLTFVVVGGGATGVEMAGAIAELAARARRRLPRIDPRSARVILVEAGPGCSPPSIRRYRKRRSARSKTRRRGAAERPRHRTAIAAAWPSAPERIETRTVIWAAGVMASPAGRGSACDRPRRTGAGHADLSVPGHPNIFVLGDTARARRDGKPLPGVAPVAKQQGIMLRALIARARGERRRRSPIAISARSPPSAAKARSPSSAGSTFRLSRLAAVERRPCLFSDRLPARDRRA